MLVISCINMACGMWQGPIYKSWDYPFISLLLFVKTSARMTPIKTTRRRNESAGAAVITQPPYWRSCSRVA